MKFLTMCQGGNSRSVGMAYLLKYQFNHDAIACSWQRNDPETIDMLCKWADKIVVMEKHFEQYIPEKYKYKLYICDVGPDIWMNGLHPALHSLIQEKLQGENKDILDKREVVNPRRNNEWCKCEGAPDMIVPGAVYLCDVCHLFTQLPSEKKEKQFEIEKII